MTDKDHKYQTRHCKACNDLTLWAEMFDELVCLRCTYNRRGTINE